MKIHLPVGLRKALLACLAAVAMPATLSATFGTASGIAVAMYAASQEAQAVENPPAEAPWIMPIAVTTGATTDKDAEHKTLTGEEVIYSGTIYTWDVTTHTNFHNGGSGTGSGAFTPWIPKADGTGMEDDTANATTSGTGDFWKHFVACDTNGDTLTYDTLRLVGATGDVTLDARKMSSTAGSTFGLGGLIVEEGGSYTIDVAFGDNNANPMALYWGAGTGTNKFDALILSDTTFTGIRHEARANYPGENYGFHILADADVRIAKGKTLAVEAVMQIAEGKTLTLSAVGEGETATFRVNGIDTTAVTGETPALVLGSGVHMEVTEGAAGLINLTLETGSNLALKIGASGTFRIGTMSGEGTLNIDLSAFSGNRYSYRLFTSDISSWYSNWQSRVAFAGINDVKLNEDGTLSWADADGKFHTNIFDKTSYTAAAADSTKNAKGEQWDIDVDAADSDFHFQGSPGKSGDWNSVTNADLNFLQTLTIKQGSDGKTQTFNGALKGADGVDMIFHGWGAAITNTWQFNGDLSGFGGDILATAGILNVTFGAEAKSNTGAIKQDGGTLNLTLNGQAAGNSEIYVNDLHVNGIVGFADSAQVTSLGTTTFGESTELTLGSNTHVHLGTLAADSTLTKLTLGEGAEFGWGSGSLTITTLELNNDASLALTAGEGNRINLTTFTDNTHILTIYLDGLTNELMGQGGYALFGDNIWQEGWAGKIEVVGDVNGREVMLNDQAKVVWAHDVQDITWTGSDGATLEWQDGGTGWDESQTFYNGDNVTLTGSGSEALQVNVTGDVATGNLVIEGTNTAGFIISSAGEQNPVGTLLIGGDLTVSKNATFNLGVTVVGNIVLNGDAVLTVHDNFRHDGDVSTQVNGTGTFKVDLSNTANSTTFDASGLSFTEDITVECAGNSGWSNFKNLNVLGTLKVTGHEVVLQGTNVITSIDASGLTANEGHITFDHDNVSTTFKNKVTVNSGYLDVRAGTVILENGATLENVAGQNAFSMSGGTLDVTAGGMGVTGTMTMIGGTLTVTAGGMSITGAMTMSGGTLNVAAEGMSVTGAMTMSGGTLNVTAGDMSVGTDMNLTTGTVTLSGSEAGLNITGGLTVNGANATINVEQGTVTVDGDFTFQNGHLTAKKLVANKGIQVPGTSWSGELHVEVLEVTVGDGETRDF